jgi:hypothetical protein
VEAQCARQSTTVGFDGRGMRAVARTGGRRWRRGDRRGTSGLCGPRHCGDAAGGQWEAAVDGELHAEDEADGAGGCTVTLAGGFTCG